MSTPIPEDVREIAGRIVLDFGFDAALLEGAVCAALIAAEKRGEQAADERAAKIADKHADGRRAQSKDMAKTAKERRDFESMSIACVQVASAIRDRSKT